ncbi:MAG: hypothetical protein DHS80DRAFT_24778 [Piptocephalis tieghemiana]|nr:MAG: hypothetical protein DHS80DRAFT_24778 [Piptocephalis tieghemiana]
MHNRRKKPISEAERKRQRDREAGQIVEYRALVQQLMAARKLGSTDLALIPLIDQATQWNPDFYTAWALRRDILHANVFSNGSVEEKMACIKQELKCTEKAIRDHPKSYWVWGHRRWALEVSPEPLWKGEMTLVGMMLELDPRNFHGWDYRRFLLSRLEADQDPSTVLSLLRTEYAYTEKKISQSFSNASAWHHRSKLFPRLLADQVDNPTSFLHTLDHEFSLIHNAMYTDPSDQSAWMYYQWLIKASDLPSLPGEKEEEGMGQRQRQRARSEYAKLQELLELLEEKERIWPLHLLLWMHQQGLVSHHDEETVASDRVVTILQELITLDPSRQGRYKDLLQSSPIPAPSDRT